MAGYNEVFTNLKLSKILLKLKFYLLEIKGKKAIYKIEWFFVIERALESKKYRFCIDKRHIDSFTFTKQQTGLVFMPLTLECKSTLRNIELFPSSIIEK